MKRGSVWWANLGKYEGHIQGGFRPVVILGNWKGLKYSSNVLVVPVTSRLKRLDMTTHVIGFNYNTDKPCVAMCEQIMTVSRETLVHPMREITFNIADIDAALKEALGIEI